MGFPTGPPFGRVFPPSDRPVKKFALRPNAKEFIPPSMLKKAADEAEQEQESESMADSAGVSEPDNNTDTPANDAADSARDGPVCEDAAPQADSLGGSDHDEETIAVQVNRGLATCSCDEDVPVPEIVDASKAVVQPIEQRA